MKANKDQILYSMPNMGCLVGTAYQTLVSQLSEALADSNLHITAAEYMILRALYTEEGMQQCQLADIVGKDQSAVCRTVAIMEKKGLLHTEVVSHKCRRVTLSEKAQAMRPDVLRIAAEREKALRNILSPDEMKSFETILKKIIERKTL